MDKRSIGKVAIPDIIMKGFSCLQYPHRWLIPSIILTGIAAECYGE